MGENYMHLLASVTLKVLMMDRLCVLYVQLKMNTLNMMNATKDLKKKTPNYKSSKIIHKAIIFFITAGKSMADSPNTKEKSYCIYKLSSPWNTCEFEYDIAFFTNT